MWVIEGPFDGLDKAGRTKRKALFTGATYPLGRSSEILHLAPNIVSNEHALLITEKQAIADVADLDKIPPLQYTQLNKKKVAIVTHTDGTETKIPPNQSANLRSGDSVSISGGAMRVSVQWVPINILIRSGLSRDERVSIIDALADFGFKVVRTWSKYVTHVVFASVSVPCDLKVLLALVHGVHFVSPSWLRHVKTRGKLEFHPGDSDAGGATYQAEYCGLEEEKFSPENAASPAWAPNTARSSLFKGVRFIHITVPDSPPELQEVLSPGQVAVRQVGTDDETTADAWENELALIRKSADKKKVSGITTPLVILADPDALEAELGARWSQIYAEGLRSSGLRTVWLAELSEAVLQFDISRIDCVIKRRPSEKQKRESEREEGKSGCHAHSSPLSLPKVIPSTHPEEPSLNSVEESSSRKLPTRRATRRTTPAPEAPDERGASSSLPKPADKEPEPEPPVEAPPDPVPAPPKRPLRRHVTAGTRAGSREPVDVKPMIVSREPSIDLEVPPPVRTGLKRRATARPGTQKEEESAEPSQRKPVGEAPHKRFKALFEGTLGSGEIISIDENGESAQPPPPAPESARTAKVTFNSQTLGSKRKAGELLNIDEEDEDEGGSATSNKKRRTDSPIFPDPQSVESLGNSGGSEPPSQSQSQSQPRVKAEASQNPKVKAGGAIHGSTKEPDQEPQFLQALASRTKTKSKEDQFDREFNRLRIAVPDKKAKVEEELAVWNEVEHDPAVRGNFMVIEYCDLVRKDKGSKAAGKRPEWNGMTNFKKFKKKEKGARVKVELDLPPPVDYGLGDSYWEKDEPNMTVQLEAPPIAGPSQPKPRKAVPPAKKKALELRVYSSEEEDVPPPRATKTRSTKAKTPIDLHFSEEEEDELAADPEAAMEEEEKSEVFDMNVSGDEGEEDFVMSNTLKSTNSKSRSQRVPQSTGPPSVSQRSTGTSTKRRLVPQADSDDDDPMAFKGFKRKKLKR